MASQLVFIDPIPPNLPSPGRSLLFDVTGVSAAGVTVTAEYSTGAYEVVHDGSEFAQVYAAQSVRTQIAGGFQFRVKRAGGWFGDTVTIRTFAADAFGEEDAFVTPDDFLWKEADRWTETIAGAATATIIDGDVPVATGAGAGIGVLRLQTIQQGDSIEFHDLPAMSPAMDPLFEARIRTPVGLGNVTWEVGLSNEFRTSYARMFLDAAGFWVVQNDSDSGGGPQESTTTNDMGVAATWYSLRIEVVDGIRVRYLVDGTLIAEHTTVVALPATGDRLATWFRSEDIGAPDSLYCDRVEVSGTRL